MWNAFSVRKWHIASPTRRGRTIQPGVAAGGTPGSWARTAGIAARHDFARTPRRTSRRTVETLIKFFAERTAKWDGKFHVYDMGTAGSTPDLLLQVPAGPVETARK